MSECVVVKKNGRLEGLGAKWGRAFAKFRKMLDELEEGETLQFSWRHPRSRSHHGFFFSKLQELFDRQERFADRDRLLDWLKVGAGHADILPGMDGIPVAIPRTINWMECDEQTFIEVARGMNDFLWTDYAQETLWPHLDQQQRHDNVAGWHEQAEMNRKLAIARRQEREI